MKRFILKFIFIYFLFGVSNSLASDLFFNSEGVKIHYKEIGSGTPVVLLHGYTMNSNMWDNSLLLKTLSKTHRIITVDFRGHGLSDKPSEPKEYGPKVGIDVIRLLDHLNISKAHLVGFSMGSYVVGRLLVTHPDKIASATLGSGFFPFSDKNEELFAEETAIHMEKQAEKSIGGKREILYAMAAVARGWKYDAITDQQISKIKVPMQAIFGSEERNELFEYQNYRLMLPSTALPIFIIKGADHDSKNAAILRVEFVELVEKIINRTSTLKSIKDSNR
jgi:pimeloyl-ACP methyl ester carboxylesterase